jgi:ribosomal protein S18 acetylase RimI-like enzyme
MTDIRVREALPDERAAIDALHEREWGGPYVVAHDTRYDLRSLPTLVGVDEADGAVVGALVWRADDDGLEVVSIAAATPGRGVGRALLSAAVDLARERGLRRIWLITTNDNLRALRFYQLNALRIVAVDPGAVDRARAIKPTIPTVATNGIPLHDELTLELRLTRRPSAR